MDGEYVELEYESASVRIKEKNGKYILTNLIALERGLGHATRLMERVSEYADVQRIDLELIASPSRLLPINTILTHEELVIFYHKFGFREIVWTKPVRMLRLCK